MLRGLKPAATAWCGPFIKHAKGLSDTNSTDCSADHNNEEIRPHTSRDRISLGSKH